MKKDIRASDLYREIETLCKTLRQPGTGQISDATEIHAAPDGKRAVFAGTLMDTLDGIPPTRICLTELATGDTRVLTFGPNVDRSPKFSPDGCQIAFLSDRHRAGDFQLYLLEPKTGAVTATPQVEGWVEYLHWSPDGKRLLLGVAGRGADVSGVQGAITSPEAASATPSWMPNIDTEDESRLWRRAWMYELATGAVRQVMADANIWEATWCGNEALAAVVSAGPGEGLWYSARLVRIEIGSGHSRELFTPTDQLGWPAASPSGKYLAVVEALCSDRWVVAGELRLIDTVSGELQRVDTNGVDVTHTEWRSDQKLLLAGHRGFETVVGMYDVATGTFTDTWRSDCITSYGNYYVTVSGVGRTGDCVLVGEGYTRAPEIAMIQRGEYRSAKSFDLGYAHETKSIDAVEQVTWRAPDGLEIQGWLLRPDGKAPHPLVLLVHGGPIGLSRPRYLGRTGLHTLALLRHGYAVFFPNPRGSAGRGQEFARYVLGDMGGAETADHLSGLDYLVEKGIADPKRLGVTGVSHGGFMASWIITQDNRFAAVVAVSPVTNQVTQQLISNIPHFVTLFLKDKYTNPNGKYFERSPIMHAHKAKTPTLNICGAHDRCTPPEEAVQFHNALLQSGVKSVLLTYPEEGHGIRKLPAYIDYSARVVAWFEKLMPARPK